MMFLHCLRLLEVDTIDDVPHFLPLAPQDGVKTLVFDVGQEGIFPASLELLPVEVPDRSLVLVINVSGGLALVSLLPAAHHLP